LKDLNFSQLNILVVDDINVNRRVCVAQLQKLGVRKISEAEDGRKAIAAAQSQVFDLILMDVQMPGNRRVTGDSADSRLIA
jgi:CheY-like chemotaxis protein